MIYGVDHSCSLDLVLLWLWGRPAAIDPIGPLAWEPPYAMGVALEKTKKKKKEERKKKTKSKVKKKKSTKFYRNSIK